MSKSNYLGPQSSRDFARAAEVYAELQHATTEAEAVEVMRGERFAVFTIIDEKPGSFTPSYHQSEGWRMLRCARNNPDLKPGLFDVLVR